MKKNEEKTDLEKLRAKIIRAEKRVASCVPKSIRRAFNEELCNYTSLKIQESRMLNETRITGFCPDEL